MMYYYWVHKGKRPSFFSNMGQGELTIIRAFYEMEIEDLKKAISSS